MPLERVTLTGVDESLNRPEYLLPLSERFPFVEWGVLFSSRKLSASRYPQRTWRRELVKLTHADGRPLRLALHLCGTVVSELLQGRLAMSLDECQGFQRVQLNFAGDTTPFVDHEEFSRAAFQLSFAGLRQLIFQLDGKAGPRHLDAYLKRRKNAVPLFDLSHGRGALPERWSKPLYMQDETRHCPHGYAGGLGPDVLERELPKILAAAGENCPQIWIDMETHVRTGRRFDLEKAWRVLEICEPWVG